MKNLLLIIVLLFFSCSDEINTNNCFADVKLNTKIYLNNPEFINLQVISGNTITQLLGRDVLIIRTSSSYKAFDLACPELKCEQPMSFDGLKLKCSCTDKAYNSLNGSPIDGKGCFALEYTVTQINNSILQITR